MKFCFEMLPEFLSAFLLGFQHEFDLEIIQKLLLTFVQVLLDSYWIKESWKKFQGVFRKDYLNKSQKEFLKTKREEVNSSRDFFKGFLSRYLQDIVLGLFQKLYFRISPCNSRFSY